MTKSGSPNKRWVCRYCGLDTGVPTNHAGTHDCVDALRRELDRLRDQVRHRVCPDTPETAVSPPPADQADGPRMSADATPAPTIEAARDRDQSLLKQVARIARREAEGMMIMRMLQQTRGNRRQAAINLGISYKAFQYKAKEHVNRE